MATLRSTAPLLAIVPHGPLSTADQLEALRRTQSQADLRMKIGVQLVKAAEAQATQHHSLLTQVKAHQDALREQIKADVAADLRKYDHQIARIDDDFTQRLQSLEDRIDGLSRQWEQSRRKIDVLLNRADNLLEEGDAAVAPHDAGAAALADPHAGATVAPPALPESVLESAAPLEGATAPLQPEATEPGLRLTDLLGKLDSSDQIFEADRPA